MLLATVSGTGYKVMFVLHILSVLVAFAPAVIHPILGSQLKKQGLDYRSFSRLAARNGRMVHLPALILVPVFGMGMVGMSDKAYTFEQAWVGISTVLWIAICGLVTGVILPSERKVADGDESAEQRLRVAGAVTSLLLVVVLFLMTFKPGL